MKLGAHISTSGGLPNVIERTKKVGGESFQIFTSNPRGWQFNERSPEEISEFAKQVKENNFSVSVGHAIYLTNFASNNPYIYTNSINSLVSGLNLAEKAGLLGVVIHIGSGEGKEALERVVNALKQSLAITGEKTAILLETDSGSGNHIGTRFEEIAEIIKLVGSKKVKVCFDTAHVFAAGYDLTSKDKTAKVINEFDKIIGLDRLAAFHLNDSKSVLGSKVDRHEEIGKGKIGLEAFEYLLSDIRFKDLPGIVETPDNKDYERSEKLSLDVLKELRDGNNLSK